MELETAGLGHAFGELEVIERLDLRLESNEVLGIVGPSGCGKSTLLELVAGLREPSRGRIAVEGKTEPEERLAGCTYMPQRDLLLPCLSVIDNACLALRNRGMGGAAARSAAAPLFQRFGLEGFESARPGELSGGMRQRVAFLRTLVAGKPVLLLDEPFGSLDTITRGGMQAWLASALTTEPRTVVLVTHDVEEALYLCDRVIVLSRRPARAIATIESPAPRWEDRLAEITSPGFGERRQQALAALQEGMA